MAYAELFAGLQGEEESFEDYAPKAVRIPGAHYEQMSLFSDVITGGYEYVNGRLQKGV